MKKNVIFLFILCVFYQKIFCDEYPYRKIDKPIFKLKQNEKIIQCSPPRTGSTLIYNILNYLFEEKLLNHVNPEKKVLKSHSPYCNEYLQENMYKIFYVITIRYPVEEFFSMYNIRKKLCAIVNFEEIVDEIIDRNIRINNFLKTLSKDKYLLLKYEDFENDFDYIFGKLESFFLISISHEEKNKIRAFFSRDAMKKIIKKFESFDQFDSITGIHGDHINNLNIKLWKDEILKDEYLYISKRLEKILNIWNY